MLRKIVWQVALMMVLAPSLWAQDHKVEFSGNLGYTFSEGFTIDPVVIGGSVFDEINPTSGVSYNFMVGVFVSENMEIGFLYGRQDSSLEAKGTTKREFADMTVNNYHGIFTYNFGYADSVARPFIFGGLGATNWSPGDVEGVSIDGATKFSTTWGGGVKVYPSQHVGVQVMGRWTPTYVKSDPAGIWCSPWWPWGCYVLSETDYSNQLELTGGVTFRF